LSLINHWSNSFVGDDANDLLIQANKWQKNDVGKTAKFGGDLEAALRSIKARVLLVPSQTDQYFFNGPRKS
jgi:homoserine O-acetyltransferase